MARNLAVTVTVIIFLFTFAYAHTRSDLQENDVPIIDTLPESDPKAAAAIILPSDKPDSEPANLVELEPEPEKNLAKPEIEPQNIETKYETQTVPLTFISFRPNHRHFPRRPLLPFRHGGGHHRCRHGHGLRRHGFKPWGPREIPYGNDMILSGGEDLSFEPVSRSGLARPMQAKWASFDHGRPRFSYSHDDVAARREEMMMKGPHHHHHQHHDDRHDEEEEEREHEHEREEGFMKGIRKFLKGYHF